MTGRVNVSEQPALANKCPSWVMKPHTEHYILSPYEAPEVLEQLLLDKLFQFAGRIVSTDNTAVPIIILAIAVIRTVLG